MAILDYDRVIDIEDGEFPFYERSKEAREQEKFNRQNTVDSLSVQTIDAVTAAVAGPNKLVATGNDGKLPLTVIPNIILNPVTNPLKTGTYSALKAGAVAAVYFGYATDLKQLFFYANDATVGDGGWVLIGG